MFWCKSKDVGGIVQTDHIHLPHAHILIYISLLHTHNWQYTCLLHTHSLSYIDLPHTHDWLYIGNPPTHTWSYIGWPYTHNCSCTCLNAPRIIIRPCWMTHLTFFSTCSKNLVVIEGHVHANDKYTNVHCVHANLNK